MSSGGFASTLDLQLTPSQRALRWIYFIHLAALLWLALASEPGIGMVIMALLLGLSWWSLRRHAVFGFGPQALRRLMWQPDTGWHVWDQDAMPRPATLLDDSFINSRLLVLNFRVEGKRRSRALLGDELSEQALRRLRAHLMGAARRDDASGSGGPT